MLCIKSQFLNKYLNKRVFNLNLLNNTIRRLICIIIKFSNYINLIIIVINHSNNEYILKFKILKLRILNFKLSQGIHFSNNSVHVRLHLP